MKYDSVYAKGARLFQFLLGLYLFLLILASGIDRASLTGIFALNGQDFLMRTFFGVLYIFPYARLKSNRLLLIYAILLLFFTIIGITPMMLVPNNPQLSYDSAIMTLSTLVNVFFILRNLRRAEIDETGR